VGFSLETPELPPTRERRSPAPLLLFCLVPVTGCYLLFRGFEPVVRQAQRAGLLLLHAMTTIHGREMLDFHALFQPKH
jgi:hypothetical protein